MKSKNFNTEYLDMYNKNNIPPVNNIVKKYIAANLAVKRNLRVIRPATSKNNAKDINKIIKKGTVILECVISIISFTLVMF